MKKQLLLSSLIATSMLITGCSISANNNTSNNESSSEDTSSLGEGKKSAYTVMIYLCGSDLESGYDSYYGSTDTANASLATADITEILSVKNKPDNVNIIIETGGARAWNKKYGISADKIGRWHVENNKLVNDAQLNYTAMGSTTTFQSFLEWGLKEYPAEKTGVILWNHGGAMRGVCYDETTKGNDDPLLNSEVQSALAGAFKNTGREEKLEWIGYDACLMQVQDIAEANSKYFNYMVASQESEAGEGWAYNTWLDDLYAGKNTDTILTAMCDGFVDAFDKLYPGYDNDQTLSYLNLSYMSEYKTAWENFSEQLSSNVKTYTKSKFQTLMKKVKEYGTTVYTKSDLQEMGYSTNSSSQYYFGNYGIEQVGNYYYDWGYNYFGVFDVKDMLSKIKSDSAFSSLSSYISAVESAYNNLVSYNVKGDQAGNSNGLSAFFPLNSNCQKATYYSASQTNFTNYRSFVNTYGA